jgi:hypothetical protein
LTVLDSSISNNAAATGGGIDNQGTIALRNSTVYGNSALGQSNTSGGGIENHDQGTVIVSNSSIDGNYASQYGAAISNHGSNTVTITNSTISGNRADVNGGIYTNAGQVELGNTILKTGSVGANIFSQGGSVTSHGYNLSDDDGAGFLTAAADQINTDAMLGPLANNGGATLTHALLPGSPAIDAGDPNFTAPPITDQRGYPRVYNGRIDIGSFETQTAPTPSPTPTPTPASIAQLANISTRLHVGTANDVGIGGFIITGAGTLQVALRGIGPSLASQGIPDFLADPTLELHDSSGALLARNDNWQDDPNQVPTLIQLGLAPTSPNESALVQTLPTGAYTAILAGNNGGTGVGLVEVYNVDHSVPLTNNQLTNISTRGLVETGNNVMIGGFILSPGANTNVVIRGLGPSLSNFGIPNPLADPTLELRDSSGTLVASNDNCTGSSLPPPNPLESCIEMSLAPAAYTAILAGNNGGTGVGLVEIYNLQ